MKKILIGLSLVAVAAFASGENLKACMGCHGQNFEKAAMGKSKIVRDMSEKDIATALKGYKDGTYGGPMKGIMKMQAAKIQNPEMAAKAIKAVSLGKSPKTVEKEMCVNHLEKIKECVMEAKTDEKMQECRENLVKFADKVKSKHLAK